MQDARNNPEKYDLERNARVFSNEQQKLIDELKASDDTDE